MCSDANKPGPNWPTGSGQIPVLFEDNHLIVVDKPAGLLSQGEHTSDPNLVDWARARFGRNYVGLIHRLDRNTSGLMVIAKRSKSAQRLTEGLLSGTLKRTYLAWVIGKLDEPTRWQHSLVKDERTNTVKAFPSAHPPENRTGAKLSSLKIVPLSQSQWRGLRLTLARFELETGRSHQIRAQSQAQGFPLLGDIKYPPSDPALARASRQFGRPALHSAFLSFEHPMTRLPMDFEAHLPEDMRSIQPLR